MPLNIRQRPAQQIIIQHGEASSQTTSYQSEEESSQLDSYTDDDDYDQLDDDEDDEDDVDPSDSASAIHERPAVRTTHAIPHANPRYHQPPRQQPPRQQLPRQPPHFQSVQNHAPIPPSNVEHIEDYGHYGRGYPTPAGTHAGYYQGRGGHAPGYPQNHGNPYMGGYPGSNQMVAYAGYGANPFSPMSNGTNGNSYFGGEGRGMYDMMPYQQGYYGAPPGHYQLPTHLQRYGITPPPPPPTEPPAKPGTPAPKEPPPPDPEKLRLEAELAAFKAKQEEAKQAEKQKEIEAQIRKDAEEAFQRRMEDMRRAQEEAKKEIERAKVEAERAARERIEAERKAEEERARQHAEAMQRAEEKARMKFEAELKEADERRQREEEARARAEETARIRLEQALRREAEAKAAADKKIAEEAARLKQIEEDAKRKAEAEALAKVEADKQKAKEAAEAEAKAKAEAEELKKKIEDEAREKYEEAKKKAEKPPIRFKDAVGRKFSFPYHLCATWQGMEDLIKQAFLQVDVLGPHVQEGHYDLTGPNGEIILPSVWEKVVEPDWQITMTMWPMDKSPPVGPRPGPPPGGRHRDAHGRGHGIPVPPMDPRFGGRPPPVGMPPGTGIPPPPGWQRPPPGGMPPNVVNVHKPSSKSKKNSNSAVLTFLTGKPVKKKSSSKNK